MFYIKEEPFKTKDGDAFSLTEALGRGRSLLDPENIHGGNVGI